MRYKFRMDAEFYTSKWQGMSNEVTPLIIWA